MSEIYCFVRTTGTFEDGDVLAAFTVDRAGNNEIEKLANPRNEFPAAREYRSRNDLREEFLKRHCKFRFERRSRNVADRINIRTGATQPFSLNSKLAQFIRKMLERGGHDVYGARGREIWYKERRRPTARERREIADIIKVRTGVDPRTAKWPAGVQDLKSYIAIPMEPFSEAQADMWVESLWDRTNPDEPVLLQKRQYGVDWRASLTPEQQAQVMDPNISVDLRSIIPPIAVSAVIKKPAP